MSVVFILPFLIITLMLSDIIEMISDLWDNSKKKEVDTDLTIRIIKEDMKTKQIRNGSLYFNLNKQRVERVRSKANSGSVFTTVHGEQLSCVPSRRLSIAQQPLVEAYLG